MFLEAITKRSARYGGAEDPIEVLNDILPVYRKMLQERQIDEVAALRTQLRFSSLELEEAFKAGEIDKSTYDAQRQLIISIMQKELKIGIEKSGKK